MRPRINGLSFKKASVHQRLLLVICTLLLLTILIYGFANYYSLKKTNLLIGKERVRSLTTQLDNALNGQMQAGMKEMRRSIDPDTLSQYINSGGKTFADRTMRMLKKFEYDTTWISTNLVNVDLVPVYTLNKQGYKITPDVRSVLSAAKVVRDSSKIGKIYHQKSMMYYPIITVLTNKKNITGYVILWREVKANPKTVTQLSQFAGPGAKLYIGNADGSLWTDMVKPVTAPALDIKATGLPMQYNDKDAGQIIASVLPIAHTDWLIAVAFSEKSISGGMTFFINGIIIVGILLMIIGIIAAWFTSHNLTRPLKRLTTAAVSISQGNYHPDIVPGEYGNDEIGQLANAFDSMAVQVYRMHQDLENKVTERTAQLENVNKELEAFSYSISHDLRTPLRAITGYGTMLKEDYESKLDTEGNRIINNIVTNARMMGQLIDDLLAFSRLGKKELVCGNIDMQLLVSEVANELIAHEPGRDYTINIGLLPPARVDLALMRQVWVNLMSNALKYASKNPNPEIEIGFKNEEKRIIYFIKDNGVGFDMAYAGKLFGVFQRLHTQEEFEGTGVGLALVKRIIDKHKGEAWAEGKIGSGATFYFSIPKF